MALELSHLRLCAVALCIGTQPVLFAVEGESDLERRLRALEEQNRRLAEQVENQARTISQLKDRLSQNVELEPAPSDRGGWDFGRVHLSGEGGVGYFHTQSEGAYRHGSFLVDEAKLFLEAPLWEDTYFFGELDMIIRETDQEFFKLGELYVDFEHITRRWFDAPWLNLRVGRIDIPFGEEYLARDVIDNPLISHSLSDLWGIDEGIELYGSMGKWSYVVAVQNGGHPMLKDFDSDKSVAARLSYDPVPWLHFSGSAMRTGNIAVEGDEISEMWFGNGFFRSIGAPGSTTRFEANLFELDAQTFWKSGHLKLAAGYIEYDDDDRSADRRRDTWYYYAEAVQDLTGHLYAAGRFSHIIADDGFPLVGHGDFGDFLFGPLTSELWRLSLGLGHRWNENLLTKVEYTLEEGELLNGGKRNHENFLGAQVGFQF